MKRRKLIAAGVLSLVAQTQAVAQVPPTFQPSSSSTAAMKLRLTFNGQSVTATLDDTPSGRDFASQLPLTLALQDHASTEKIAYLPRKLSTQGAPAGIDPSVGDIAYYAPWGNLALFYRDFDYSPGLIRLGRFDGSTAVLAAREPLTVTIELLSPLGRPSTTAKP